MNILNIDALFFIIYFVIPGVIATKTHDLIVPAEKRNWVEMGFELLSYSVLNFFIYFLLAPWINYLLPVLNVPTLISSKVIDYRSVLFVSLIIPVVFGFLSVIVPKSPPVQKLLRGVILHPEPTAWDYLFSDRRKCYGILFHLKSGSKIGGIYGEKSYVSSFPHPKEIYVDQVCEIGERGQLLSVKKDSAGAFISIDECSHIELYIIPSKRRNSWQRIKTWWSKNISPRLPKWNREGSSKEKGVALLKRQILPSQLGKVELSPSSPPIQGSKAEPALQPVPLQTQAAKAELEFQPVPLQAQVTKVEVAQTPPQAQAVNDRQPE